MEDERIVELLFERSEQALRELELKYGHICHSVAFNILHDAQDAEECVNDAYLGTWNAIPPHRPQQLLPFVCRIVRNLSIARHHANRAAKRDSSYDVALEELEECLASLADVEDEREAAELSALLDSFLEALPREDRVIFMRRYWFSDSYRQIAERVGISEGNVSVRLTRIRKRLRKYLAERGVLV